MKTLLFGLLFLFALPLLAEEPSPSCLDGQGPLRPSQFYCLSPSDVWSTDTFPKVQFSSASFAGPLITIHLPQASGFQFDWEKILSEEAEWKFRGDDGRTYTVSGKRLMDLLKADEETR